MTYESCKDAQPAQSTTTGIANCLRMDNDECAECETKSCVPFEGCSKLGDDGKCVSLLLLKKKWGKLACSMFESEYVKMILQ